MYVACQSSIPSIVLKEWNWQFPDDNSFVHILNMIFAFYNFFEELSSLNGVWSTMATLQAFKRSLNFKLHSIDRSCVFFRWIKFIKYRLLTCMVQKALIVDKWAANNSNFHPFGVKQFLKNFRHKNQKRTFGSRQALHNEPLFLSRILKHVLRSHQQWEALFPN